MMDHLAARLWTAGFPCRVEQRDRLAILVPESGFTLGAEVRAHILGAARDEGFTHVAVELDPDGAALPRD